MAAPVSVDAYIAAVPPPYRAALRKLRQTMKDAAPGATDAISYQMPALKLDGRSLVCYAAFNDHYSLFPMSLKTIATHARELKPYMAGKGTIRFGPDEPLPVGLVKRIVRTRVAELAARTQPKRRAATRKKA